jgi:hypothetical protein
MRSPHALHDQSPAFGSASSSARGDGGCVRSCAQSRSAITLTMRALTSGNHERARKKANWMKTEARLQPVPEFESTSVGALDSDDVKRNLV